MLKDQEMKRTPMTPMTWKDYFGFLSNKARVALRPHFFQDSSSLIRQLQAVF